ncbi:MAG: hypothetical protein PHH22_01705 [Clostridia bacterium]|nr:hypothetical protein [Clostridia bacterium]
MNNKNKELLKQFPIFYQLLIIEYVYAFNKTLYFFYYLCYNKNMQRIKNYYSAVEFISNYTDDNNFRNELIDLIASNLSKIDDRSEMNFSLFITTNRKEVEFCYEKFINLLFKQSEKDIESSSIAISYKFKTDPKSIYSILLIPNIKLFWIMIKKNQ